MIFFNFSLYVCLIKIRYTGLVEGDEVGLGFFFGAILCIMMKFEGVKMMIFDILVFLRHPPIHTKVSKKQDRAILQK